MSNNAKTLDDHHTEARLALERIDIAACMLCRQIMETGDAVEMKYLIDQISAHQQEARAALDALHDSLEEAQP